MANGQNLAGGTEDNAVRTSECGRVLQIAVRASRPTRRLPFYGRTHHQECDVGEAGGRGGQDGNGAVAPFPRASVEQPAGKTRDPRGS